MMPKDSDMFSASTEKDGSILLEFLNQVDGKSDKKEKPSICSAFLFYVEVDQLIPISSTSNTKVSPGPIKPPAPLSP